MKELDGVGPPLHAVIEVQLQFAAAAKEVLLRDVEVVRGDPAVIGEVAVHIGRPGVLRDHGHVDQTVVGVAGSHRNALQEVELSEISLRLLQLRRIERIAFLEEEEPAKKRRASLHVQDVRAAIEAAMSRFLSAEERNGVDGDRADPQRRFGQQGRQKEIQHGERLQRAK